MAEEKEFKFGLTAKEKLLRLAAGEGSDVEEHDDNSQQPATATSKEVTKPFKHQPAEIEAVKLGSKYLEAVEVNLRPRIAFVAKPKLPKNIRQNFLDKLFGEHMSLQAYKAGGAPPEIAQGHEELRKRASELAFAQEKELFDKCVAKRSSPAVYKNFAATISALDWKPTVQVIVADKGKPSETRSAEDIYADLLAKEAKEKQQQEAKKHHNNRKNKQQHYDVDALKALSDQKRRKLDTNDDKEEDVPLDNTKNKGTKLEVLEEADLDWDQATDNKNTTSSKKKKSQQQQQHPPREPRYVPPEKTGESILRAFIRVQLDKLVASGDLPPDQVAQLMKRCFEKVSERHEMKSGYVPLDIIELEGDAIKGLVGKYVDHYKSSS